jgi:hypothetical protein
VTETGCQPVSSLQHLGEAAIGTDLPEAQVPERLGGRVQPSPNEAEGRPRRGPDVISQPGGSLIQRLAAARMEASLHSTKAII